MKKLPTVGVVIALKDSETTIIPALQSLVKQSYPITQIMVIDNVSTDNSIALVESFKRKYHRIPMRIIKHRINRGVEGSYNEGARILGTDFVVFMHADTKLPSVRELEKLVEPMKKDSTVIYSTPRVTLPLSLWKTFNFWQKCLLVRSAGLTYQSLNGKFDCTRRKEYLSMGGSSEHIFGQNLGTGGGDAELAITLKTRGIIANSRAHAIHLHHLSQNYSLSDWFTNRKLLARTHGRVLRVLGLPAAGPVFVIVKPLLAFLSLIPQLFPYSLILLLVYTVASMDKMYRTKSTVSDYRILFLPFITIFLLYYEVFWMINGLLFLPKAKKYV